MKKLIAALLAGTIAVASATPASAHGFGWGGFAAGAVVGGLLSGAFAPYAYGYGPYYGAPLVYAPPAVWYYPPGAPAYVTPYAAQPDPVIRHVQAGLNAIGFGPLNVDGIEGPSTYNAICAFQLANGLVVDGIAGSGTLAVLDARLAAIAPPPPPAHAAPHVDHDKSPA